MKWSVGIEDWLTVSFLWILLWLEIHINVIFLAVVEKSEMELAYVK